VDFQLLGPVRMGQCGEVVPVGVRKQRFVLAVLALEVNRLVPVERLIDLIWPDEPPKTARGIIHGHISSLRAVLDRLKAARDGVCLRREDSGYLLECDPELVDAHRFIALAERAVADTDPGRRLGMLDEALGLWRGPALAGTAPEPVRCMLCRHLDEARLAAIEHRLDAMMQLALYAPVIGELTGLSAEHPERHRFTELLMTALHRTDRSGEALAVYQDLKHRLAEELGIDPPAPLQQLELDILRSDKAPPAGVDRAAVVPAQLPADVPGFCGRQDVLTQLDSVLPGAGGRPPTMVISVISGTAGVGKTALATHWAHRVRDRFPDGQIYLNLRGFDSSGALLAPAEAVEQALDALQVPGQQLPATLEGRVGLYRSLLADRRMLVVLDNARDPNQVRPLLPGAPGCLVLITSRNPLTGLVAADGAHPVGLDLLPPAHARELLARRVGPRRIAEEPEAVEQIVQCCAGLPLALTIVAARAAVHPRLALAELAAELSSPAGRLEALSGDDPQTDIRAVFQWSYQALTQPAARLFRLLGLLPGTQISVPAAASLAAMGVSEVRRVLTELTRVSLVTDHAPGHYTLHDLLRAYAGDLVSTEEPPEQRRAATGRLLDHYLHTAANANRMLYPQRDKVRLPEIHSGAVVVEFTDEGQATAWLRRQHRAMLSATRSAAGSGFDVHLWQLSVVLANFIDGHGLFEELAAIHEDAVAAAQRLRDHRAEALCRRYLAYAYRRHGRLDEAQHELLRSLEIFESIPDETGRGYTYLGLAGLCQQRGDLATALTHARQALHLFHKAGVESGQAAVLNAIGWYHAKLGQDRQAHAHFAKALTLSRRLGNRVAEAATQDGLAALHQNAGRLDEAVACRVHAVQLWRKLGDRHTEAGSLVILGDLHQARGDIAAAQTVWKEALLIFENLHRPEAASVRAKLRDGNGAR
jgi:DNA-binding SARP family transcriptional activator/tetratricopeptide (TPR) repeat protein